MGRYSVEAHFNRRSVAPPHLKRKLKITGPLYSGLDHIKFSSFSLYYLLFINASIYIVCPLSVSRQSSRLCTFHLALCIVAMGFSMETQIHFVTEDISFLAQNSFQFHIIPLRLSIDWNSLHFQGQLHLLYLFRSLYVSCAAMPVGYLH